MLCYVIIIRCCWLLLSCSNTIRHVEAAEDVFLTTLHTVVYFSMFLYRLHFYYIISLKPCSLLGCTGRNSTHIKSPPPDALLKMQVIRQAISSVPTLFKLL